MSQSRVDRLEKNAETAENLIAEIYSKLSDIEKNSKSVTTPELKRLREENEALRVEVAKWKELLIIREIRNGGNPVLRDPANVGKNAVKKSQSVGATAVEVAPISQKKSSTSIPLSKSISTTGNKAKASKSNAIINAETHVAEQPKKDAKKAQDKKPKVTEQNAAAPPAEEIDVSKLDFRIGLITECDRHPDADALYVEKIDLGEDKPRTIISGLVKHVPIEEMRNRLVVVLANLKPAKMRGILSEGMVMCASSPDKVEILIPPAGSAPGDLVQVEGFPRNPEPVMNPKKKIFETVQVDLKTNDKKEATYKGNLWVVPGKGVIVTNSLVNTMIK